MEFKLVKVEGIDSAITSLRMSNRHYDPIEHAGLISRIDRLTDYHGFFYGDNMFPASYANMPPNQYQIDRESVLAEMQKLAKYGAGVGLSAWKDAGHETILRYIDLTFVTIGLHRGAQDDLDAHAFRFNSRIVRESSRTNLHAENEPVSDWYQPRIRSVEDMLRATGGEYPESYTDEDGTAWDYVANGYVRADLEGAERKDAARGNYPLGMPSNAIWKINLYDLRHVYMRRNRFTTASPELQEGIESLADQVEQAIPGDLGKLVRYDYALVPKFQIINGHAGEVYEKYTCINTDMNQNEYRLVHVMDIQKVYMPRDGQYKNKAIIEGRDDNGSSSQ